MKFQCCVMVFFDISVIRYCPSNIVRKSWRSCLASMERGIRLDFSCIELITPFVKRFWYLIQLSSRVPRRRSISVIRAIRLHEDIFGAKIITRSKIVCVCVPLKINVNETSRFYPPLPLLMNTEAT